MPLQERTRWNMGEIRDLREQAEMPETNLTRIDAVVQRCRGDFELALEALTMSPRPAWVTELLLEAEAQAG
jgi:hypothetical protein